MPSYGVPLPLSPASPSTLNKRTHAMTLTPKRITLALAALERRARLSPQPPPTVRRFTFQEGAR